MVSAGTVHRMDDHKQSIVMQQKGDRRNCVLLGQR